MGSWWWWDNVLFLSYCSIFPGCNNHNKIVTICTNDFSIFYTSGQLLRYQARKEKQDYCTSAPIYARPFYSGEILTVVIDPEARSNTPWVKVSWALDGAGTAYSNSWKATPAGATRCCYLLCCYQVTRCWRSWLASLGQPDTPRLRLCTLSTCVCVCVPVCVCILSMCVCVHVRRAGWKISCRLAGGGGGSLQVLWQRYAGGWVGQWQEVATLPWGGHLTQGWPHNPVAT